MVATRSKYWRQAELNINDSEQVLAALAEQPLMLKRPLLYNGTTLLVGFDAGKYTELF